jgi:hypothetical protein
MTRIVVGLLVAMLAVSCGDTTGDATSPTSATSTRAINATTSTITSSSTTSVNSTGSSTTIARVSRWCEGEYGSFVVAPGWSANRQQSGDVRPSCLNLVQGGNGFFEIPRGTPDPDSQIFSLGPVDRLAAIRELVANSGSDAEVLDVTATGVTSDKALTTVVFRVVAPTPGTARPADLVVIRASYVQARDGHETRTGDRREALIIGRPTGAALWFTHPGSIVQPQPPIDEIVEVLDLIGSTFVPGARLGT